MKKKKECKVHNYGRWYDLDEGTVRYCKKCDYEQFTTMTWLGMDILKFFRPKFYNKYYK